MPKRRTPPQKQPSPQALSPWPVSYTHLDLFVEGLVPIDSLRGDRFTWRENTHEIVGERTGRRFRAGDRVQVILDRILVQERKLQFALVEEELPLTGRKPARPSSKTKQRAKKQARRVKKPPQRRGRR